MSSNILVIGSINMDLFVNTPILPRFGDEIKGNSFQQMLGGKGANQAVALARMGGSALLAGKVGKDSFGRLILETLKKEKIDTALINVDEREKTGTTFILVEPNGEHGLVYVPDANHAIGVKDIENLENVIKNSRIILTQLEIPLESVSAIIRIANKYDVPLILDAGPAQSVPLDFFDGVTILSPNEYEAEMLTGIQVVDYETGRQAAEILLNRKVDTVVIKMGEKGACIADKRGFRSYPAYSVNPVDTTGAGDAFTAALAYAISEGKDIDEAVLYGNAVGALTVSKAGTTDFLPTKEQIAEFIALRRGEIG